MEKNTNSIARIVGSKPSIQRLSSPSKMGWQKVVNKAMAVATSSGNNYVVELQNAVHAYNAGTHSVTHVPPEEVMMGRRIRRNLPLLDYGKAKHDEDLINSRNRRSRSQNERKDKRRQAQGRKNQYRETR